MGMPIRSNPIPAYATVDQPEEPQFKEQYVQSTTMPIFMDMQEVSKLGDTGVFATSTPQTSSADKPVETVEMEITKILASQVTLPAWNELLKQKEWTYEILDKMVEAIPIIQVRQLAPLMASKLSGDKRRRNLDNWLTYHPNCKTEAALARS